MTSAPINHHQPSLSHLLSARSYLESGQIVTTPPADGQNDGPRSQLKRHHRVTPSVSPDHHDNHESRPARKRGRPRLDETNDDPSEERRLQVRRAQRKYRLKKENTIQNLEARVAELEDALQTVSDLVVDFHDTVRSDRRLVKSNVPPLLSDTTDRILAEVDKVVPGSHGDRPGRRLSEGPLDQENFILDPTTLPHMERDFVDVFGYQVSHDDGNRDKLPLSSPFQATIYTYCFQEYEFSRRLQRFCLEHSYRWLVDPRSDPQFIVRVFGLLPCLPEKHVVKKNFQAVLRGGIGEPLELSIIPFYCIGGAGTHYPRTDDDGRPVYPVNMRVPRRILGRVSESMFGSSTCDSEEQMESRLRRLDLDGEWFDCHDVQGYLEQLGILLDQSSALVEIPVTTIPLLFGRARRHTTMTVDPLNERLVDEILDSSNETSNHVLDVERFFNLLLKNVRLLGRAPGFRRGDVDTALKSAIRRLSPCFDS